MNLFLLSLRFIAVVLVAPFSFERAQRMADKLTAEVRAVRVKFRAKHPEVPWGPM